MRKLFVLMIMFSVQFNHGQEDYSKYRPIEPLYDNGGISNFYDYLTRTIDFSKVQNEDNVIIAFILDPTGKMNHIKVGFCNNLEAEQEIEAALKNAKSWDMTNQRDKNYFIQYKIKLLFSENKVSGVTKSSWFKEDRGDIEIKRGEFLNSTEKLNSKDDNLIYNSAGLEVRPEYPGGMEMFYKLIGDNFRVPKHRDFSTGKIFVQFVVEKDGSLSDIKVIRHPGFGTDAEIIRVLKLSDKWKPALQKGVEVRCSFMLPVTITQPK